MDYLIELGGLALGSRLKRLSERISQEVATIYSQEGIHFEPRWFPVFHFLGSRGEASIMDIARAIAVTHPAVNQIAHEMLAVRLIKATQDKNDKRKRLLSLSKEGQRLYEELGHIWRVISISVTDALEECGERLLPALEEMEKALDRCSLPERFIRNVGLFRKASVEILEFQPAYREQFRLLNEAWIRKYFSIEDEDNQVLSAPERIVREGGCVLFARVGDRITGTCALIKKDGSTFEIAKMAVSEQYHGMGIGRALLTACVDRARSSGARFVTLETNTRLKAAVKLYERAGFKALPPAEALPSKYARVDLVMHLDLAAVPASA